MSLGTWTHGYLNLRKNYIVPTHRLFFVKLQKFLCIRFQGAWLQLQYCSEDIQLFTSHNAVKKRKLLD